jgi:hypothetical protein
MAKWLFDRGFRPGWGQSPGSSMKGCVALREQVESQAPLRKFTQSATTSGVFTWKHVVFRGESLPG